MGDLSNICEFRGRALEGKGCTLVNGLRHCAKRSEFRGSPHKDCSTGDVDTLKEPNMSAYPGVTLPPIIPGLPKYAVIGRIGTNISSNEQTTYYSKYSAYLDHTKTAQPADVGGYTAPVKWNNNAVVASDGLPTSADNGASNVIIAIDNPANRTDIAVPTRYTIITNFPDYAVGLNGWTVVSKNKTPEGYNRIVGDINLNAFEGGAGYNGMRLAMGGIGSYPRNIGTDFIKVVRTDEEASLLAGNIFRPEQVRISATGPIRFMQVDGSVGNDGAITSLDQWNPITYFSYLQRMPVAAMVALCNRAKQTFYLNLPHGFTDSQVRAIVRLVLSMLDPTLRIIIEVSNEIWNPAQPYAVGRAYYYNLYNPQKGVSDEPNYCNYGYRIAQMMAVAVDEEGNTGRILPWAGGQQYRLSVINGVISGIQTWMTDIADPANALYNPKFAALYRADVGDIGQLFWAIGGAPYMSGGINNQMSDADLATVKTWIGMGDAGKALYWDQCRNGGHLSVEPDATIANFAAKNAPWRVLATAHNVLLVAYECGMYRGDETIRDAAVDAWILSLHPDPRTRTLQRDYFTALLGAGGYDIVLQFTDVNSQGADVGILENIWDYTTQKYLGMTDVVNNCPAPAPSVTVQTAGSYTVGKSPRTSAKVTGGMGRSTLVWGGLAPGRAVTSYDRVVEGVLTTVGSGQGSVYAIDENGVKSPVVYFDQNVVAAPLGYRFVKLAPTNNINAGGYYRVGSAEFVFHNADGSIISTANTRVLANFVSNNPTSRVVDGQTNFSFITDDPSQDGTLTIDFGQGAVVNPKSIDIWAVAEAFGYSIGTLDIYIAPDSDDLKGTPDNATVMAKANFSQFAHVTKALTYSGGNSGYANVVGN